MGAWRSGLLVDDPMASLVHTSLAGHVRCEFARRLMTWGNVYEALNAVRLDPLCKWVDQAFGGVNFADMRQSLELEFSAALEAFPSPPRLSVDLDTNTITLDGVPYTSLDPRAVRLIDALRQAGGVPMSRKDLSDQVPGCKGGEKAVRRAETCLPEGLRRLIKSVEGKGTWLELPPLK
jgi:hypothetical protein